MMSNKRLRDAATGRFLQDCPSLPGVVDGTSYGTPALKVGGKLIARLHQSLDCVVLRSDLLSRAALQNLL
jgi:hypothetical protein